VGGVGGGGGGRVVRNTVFIRSDYEIFEA